jgi:DNA polymerase
MSTDTPIKFLQDVRRLLSYHQSIGLENYPNTEAISTFLNPGAYKNSAAPPSDFSLADIRDEIGDCTRCGLSAKRKNIVFGQGSTFPSVFIVADSPGTEDDETGEALSGPAGELLTKMLAAIKLTREEVFITHLVKCIPPDTRAPGVEEINTCLPFLYQQIETCKPAIICTMGPLAAQTLLRTKDSLFRMRGRFQKLVMNETQTFPLLPTMHPAFLLKNPDMKKASWQDLQLLQKKLAKKKTGASNSRRDNRE